MLMEAIQMQNYVLPVDDIPVKQNKLLLLYLHLLQLKKLDMNICKGPQHLKVGVRDEVIEN